MRTSRRALSTCLAVLGFGLPQATHAATLTVSSLADDGSPGTLRSQVEAAAAGDTIDFTVTGTIQLSATGAIVINKDLTITGPGQGSLTVSGRRFLSGTFFSIFRIGSGLVSLSGLTLSNGDGTQGTGNFQNGGAIDITGGTVTVTASTFSNNIASSGTGGAIRLAGGSLTVAGSIFSANGPFVTYGGAIGVSNASLTVAGCTFSGNTADQGGGAIYLADGGSSLTVTDTAFSGNSAGYGGAIYQLGGTSTIKHSTLSGNHANTQFDGTMFRLGSGGGILHGGGVMTLTNCTISGNSANGPGVEGGGGIFTAGVLTIANSTLTLNSSARKGGGILVQGGVPNLDNTIVANNASGDTGPDIFGSVASSAYCLIGQDPKLGPLASNGGPTQTHAMLPGSPALDAGAPNFDATALPYDQRGPGFPRIQNGRLCIGAYESEVPQSGSSLVVNTLDDHDDGIAGPTDCSLREAVRYAPAGATITFAVTGTITLTLGELVIDKNLTITGPAQAPGLTVSGGNASRIFSINATSNGLVNFSNLTLSGGNGVGILSPGIGGAINIEIASLVTVTSCTFSGNSANSAGAVKNGGNRLTVTNSTFSGNTATGGAGGAIRSGGGELYIFNSTIAGNSAATNAGGIMKGTGSLPAFQLSNSIVAGNTATISAPDINGTVTAGDYNLVGNTSGLTFSGTHYLTGNPMLGALANNGGPTQTLALLAGSPALNSGSNALIPSGVTTDQRGFARVENGTVDLGAVERETTPPTIDLSAPSSAFANSSSTVTYTVTYADAHFRTSTLSAADVTLLPTGTASATVSVEAGSGATRTVTLSALTGAGTLGIAIAAGTAADFDGNTAPAAGPSGTFAVDAVRPAVTIDQAAGQADPTISTPVRFTVVFSKPVSGFATGAVTLGGTAGATTATVTGGGQNYEVAVTGMKQSGSVLATIAAGVALDAAGNGNLASTSSDHAVSYTSPDAVQIGATVSALGGGGYAVGFRGVPGQSYTIQFTPALAPADWQPLTTQVADGSGEISFSDQPPPGTPSRFYRFLRP